MTANCPSSARAFLSKSKARTCRALFIRSRAQRALPSVGLFAQERRDLDLVRAVADQRIDLGRGLGALAAPAAGAGVVLAAAANSRGWGRNSDGLLKTLMTITYFDRLGVPRSS